MAERSLKRRTIDQLEQELGGKHGSDIAHSYGGSAATSGAPAFAIAVVNDVCLAFAAGTGM